MNMYEYTKNLLTQNKKAIEMDILQHEQEIMCIPEENYDIEEDTQEYLTVLPRAIDKFKEHLDDISSAINFLNGDTKEMEKFFEAD